ncbi:MAG: dockerin type I repeat-containing protein [Oscillospiraceae bacterium]|nr:dockerin type I repeat-containing protein [Oscillospiraceae bacterium]
MKKVITMFLAAALFLSSLTCLLPLGVVEAATAEETCVHLAQGDNIEQQDYYDWSTPVYSYLTKSAEGELMRVQANRADGSYQVEYFDADYRSLRDVQVPRELPLFGGFYAMENSYYILSGQENPDESASVECYRITKYDLDWNRLDSVGLYDCNTTIPFRAGSARMAHSGNMLLIRTCHEMYKASDGLNHQANISMQVDTETMQITDSFAGGYVSHSFNQFIKIDGDRVAAVDHGDAFPRCIVLEDFSMTDGKIDWGSYRRMNLQSFVGEIGENYTGASVGGLEISDSAYLVAYNSVPQDEHFRDYKTRNIYVSAMDKASEEVTIRQITDYAEGEFTASTPQLVKISGDSFLLLWSQYGNVYYTGLNGSGEPVSDTYCMQDSFLSDCKPIVFGGKVVWYTRENSVITFYEIDTNDVSQNNCTAIDRAKIIAYPSAPNWNCTVECTVCGHKETFETPHYMSVYWSTSGDLDTYHPLRELWGETFAVGTRLYFFVATDYNTTHNDWIVTVTDKATGQTAEGVTIRLASTWVEDGYLQFDRAGVYEIHVFYRYIPDNYNRQTVEIFCDHTLIEQVDAQYLKSEANCVSPAVYYKSCTICGEKVDDTFLYGNKNPDNHIHTRTKSAKATCTEDGYEDILCDDCDETLSHRDFPATGHDWEEAPTTVPPTCTEDGSTGIHCKNCGETKGEVTVLPATGHRFEDGVCTVCGEKEFSGLLGDVNNNGKIDAMDYLLLKRFCLDTFKLTEEQMAVADVYNDGKITALDYMLVKRHVLGTFKIA